MYLIGLYVPIRFSCVKYLFGLLVFFMAPKQTDPQFKLRMTPEIKDAIEAAAKANNRSMNAEILSRLEDSFEKPNMSEMVKTLEDLLEYAETVIAKKDEIDKITKLQNRE